MTYFSQGINRIWYRASNFKTAVDVKIRLKESTNGNVIELTLEELGDGEGLYFVDFNFDKRGSWVGVVYENGVRMTSEIFNVDIIPGIVRHITRTGS